ncbi:MerR family transcriptional regulator [Apilactobacillus xinyiensis]|uniref:MerR family transcriptional regulator n=1 Tax=Apilactobacillus xinyiensis TaxID=2841032 RepID=A0ABT0I0Z3_9LACO|nr:MerR family transcriptional regulator [Apilactobacillus xinyiensis]MCK8624191.1 MerR family transcriptional regulator [Apilactobacillus xinyiensis]MCL0311783.1 MerR family transcriptional regulator [Apilactobacillus xinyiensis]MCL0318409.1 MerR family transcriptional regulator [Apilactobacillus xinyiensis]
MKEKDLRRSLSVLPIGTVMKLTDLTARQIRYYEEQKLVIPKRNEGNRRMYSLNDIDELLEIKDYLSDGLNISDIKKIYAERASKKVEEQKRLSKNLSDQEARMLLSDEIIKVSGLNPDDSSNNSTF